MKLNYSSSDLPQRIVATLLALFGALLLASCAGVNDQRPSGFQTLAHEVLRIEHPADAEYTVRAEFLDEVIRRCLAELDRAPEPTAAAAQAEHFFATVDRVLVECNFVFPPGTELVSYLGDALVGKKLEPAEITKLLAKGPNARRREAIEKNAAAAFFISDCDTSAMIYLAVAEVKKFPCHLVEIPGHNFVRWSDGAVALNWETNYGITYSDRNYQNGAALPEVVPPSTGFMRNLTRAEILSYWTALAVGKYEKKKDYAMQRKLVQQAYALAPHALRAGNELAWFLATCPEASLRDGKRAVTLAEAVVSIWPNPNYLDTLAAAYAETGDFDRAVKIESQAAEGTKTWRRSGFESGSWADFAAYVDVYRQRKTYAEHAAEPKPNPVPPLPLRELVPDHAMMRRSTNSGEGVDDVIVHAPAWSVRSCLTPPLL